MRLTAKEIYDKTFRRSFKGYDESEVDEFLDQVIKDFVDMSEELAKIKEEKEAFDSERAAFEEERKKMESEYAALKEEYSLKAKSARDEVKSMEDRVTQTLLTAQKTADILLAESKSQADALVREAKAKADRIDGMYYVQLAKQKKNINMLRTLVEQCKSEYEFLLDKNKQLFVNKSNEILTSIDEFDMNEMDLDAQNRKTTEEAADEEAEKASSEAGEEASAVLLEEVAIEKPKPRESGAKYTSNYSDYSWLYSDDDSEMVELPKKSPEEEESLKKLIDEVSE